ncbi:hypothetical protein ACFWM5_24130 [Streptomyces bobili]|uniref:hypothetical protein n=1 Tax=Streptomyces bobili TaxID=67280 RepID=UPI00365F3F28
MSSVSCGPDGRTVTGAGNDGAVRLWDPDIAARVADLCRVWAPSTANGGNGCCRDTTTRRTCAAQRSPMLPAP